MNEEWYYAAANQQQGPVSVTALAELEKSGIVNGATLVWKQGMAGWEPWGSVAANVRAEAGTSSAGEVAVCAYSGRTYPRSQMIPYGDRLVALEHKDAFVRSLAAGLPISASATSGITQYVGFWWRVLASLIDGTIKFALNIIVSMVAGMASFGAMAGITPSSAPGSDPMAELRAMAPMFVAQGLLVLFQLAFSIFYETWMVGKYGGTLGKMALGFRVVNADGSGVTYAKAFGRWAAEALVKLIWFVPAYGIIIAIAIAAAGMSSSGNGANGMAAGLIVAMVCGAGWLLLGGFGYYMAGWTPQKTALHDKMCRTRVIRRVQ